MRAASEPPACREDVALVVIDRARGAVDVRPFAALPALLAPGDLVVVNDAATWPASLRATTPRGDRLELRLTTGAFRPGETVAAVLFGDGDWRTRTEHRPPPPRVDEGDELQVGDVALRVARVRGRIAHVVTPADDAGFRALYRAGRPVQYAHVARDLAPWDVQTTYAGRPWAVEMPSAGRPLSWEVLAGLALRGAAVAPLTHAAGLSSTGDPALDAALPMPERYDIPPATAAAIAAASGRGARVVAIGTTVVRALESAAVARGRVAAGPGVAELVLGPAHPPRVVDAVLSGLHEPTESHFRLLEAFAPRPLLLAASRRAADLDLATHELGDTLLVL